MEPAQLCGANYVPYLIFTMTVQTAGNFIQNEDLRVSDQSSSDGDALPLALGQQTVGLPQHCQHYKIIRSYSEFTHIRRRKVTLLVFQTFAGFWHIYKRLSPITNPGLIKNTFRQVDALILH